VGTLYIHPPFEAVLYLVVAWLPLRRAYLLFCLLNLGFLAAAARRLTQEVLHPWDWQMALAASLTFVPLLLCLLQGQDSLLLLLLMVLAFTSQRRDRVASAGCWLGLGLFKFELVLPLAFMLLLTQSPKAKRAFTTGFGLIAAGLAGFSAALCGWSVFSVYPRFLLSLQSQAFAGIAPQAMANFRGLAFLLFRDDNSPWAVAAIFILSAAALIEAVFIWKRAKVVGEFDLAFAVTILFSLLVSYHLNPHDLSLLLLPISLLLHLGLAQPVRITGRTKWIVFSLLAVLFLPPLHLWALKTGVYALVAIPILILFLTCGSIGSEQSFSRVLNHERPSQK
jgi:hypothetical protein